VVGAAAALLVAIVGAVVALDKLAPRSSAVTVQAAAAPAALATAGTAPPGTDVARCPAGMVLVMGGGFFMGSDDGPITERPAHHIALSPYCIDVLETTTQDYRACSNRGECKRAAIANEWSGIADGDRRAFDPLCNARDLSGRGRHPINCVDWDMAFIYCHAHGKRLPTEAEWELAARGPDGRRYPWGDEEPSPQLLNGCGRECFEWAKRARVDQRALFGLDDGWANTAPVGSFPKGASPAGLQDVEGNVAEWVGDFYAEYTFEDKSDPRGPLSGVARVVRGAAWNTSFSSSIRPTYRHKEAPSSRSHAIGFRCARSL
jgi:formylglycine-generating enzyme required for sulfatase activity